MTTGFKQSKVAAKHAPTNDINQVDYVSLLFYSG
jgi:hypothetical protein